MKNDFWLRKWESSDIRFHQSEAHPTLVREWTALPAGRVLVPLCGKTLDLAWLRSRGHTVAGAELSPIACRDFFEENRIAYTNAPAPGGTHEIYRGDGIEIWCGDYFALPPSWFEGATAVYDRAALIALPAELRERYAAFLRAQLPRMSPALEMLLITVEYAEGTLPGPPFAVSEEEVRRHYSSAFARIDRLSCEADEELSARNPAAGAGSVSEAAYRLRRSLSLT